MFHELTDGFEVRSGPEACWRFFSQAENLPRITPPWLKFTIDRAGPISDGSILDYTIRWMGLKLKWRTQIIDWSPMRQFIDLQTRGPYALWHHQHTFEPSEAGVVCRDRVIYKLSMGPLGAIAHATMVRPQLMEIFKYRRKVIGEALGLVRLLQEEPRIQALR